MHSLENTGVLACPICKSPLEFFGNSIACGGARRHNFDIAKSGYVNLNTHAPTSGDDKEMARARQSFLRRGYYLPFAEQVQKAVGSGKLLIDAGCGEGYYTEKCASAFDAALGVDLSKYALDLAAKSAKQCGAAQKILYTTASVYELPVNDGVCDTVVNIFAPCAEEEYLRVLKKGGRLVVGCAGRDHLHGLKEFLYDIVIPNDERRDLPQKMKLAENISVRYEAEIFGDDIYSLFMMTPYFYKTGKSSAEKLKKKEVLRTLLDFEVRVYVKE